MKSNVEQIVNTLLSKVGIDNDGIEEKEVVNQVFYNIKVSESDSGLLIGEKGFTMRALNLLINRLLERELNSRVRIILDVNDYKRNHIDSIIENAEAQARVVKELKHSLELQPANGYERMLVHSYFAKDKNIKTSSIGEGFDRRVVIKWVD